MADSAPAIEAPRQLRRESTAEQVAGAVGELILGAQLAPGTRLREGPLAAQLGVSRNTVREAIQILVSQGLVRREAHHGAYVARPTADDIRDIFRVRRLVELTAVRELAHGDALGSLADLVQVLEAAIASGQRQAITEADLSFHRQLVELMQSTRLAGLYAGVDAELRLCIALAAPATPPPAPLGDHRDILAALERADAALAEASLLKHLDQSERVLLASFEASEALRASSGGRMSPGAA